MKDCRHHALPNRLDTLICNSRKPQLYTTGYSRTVAAGISTPSPPIYLYHPLFGHFIQIVEDPNVQPTDEDLKNVQPPPKRRLDDDDQTRDMDARYVFFYFYFLYFLIYLTNDLQLPTMTTTPTYDDNDQCKQDGEGWEGEEATNN